MLGKILIANRAEIAVRILRACKEMDIPCVAIYSEADKDASFVKHADEAYCVGRPPAAESYLDIKKIIDIAKRSGADAVHPGYGFLAENPEFARAAEQEGIKFIGPSTNTLRLLGDKVAARSEMMRAGVPVIPGSMGSISNVAQALNTADDVGYPVMVKPSCGGGGIGMTIASDKDELLKAWESSQVIARNTFGAPDVYLEKYLFNPRHIEFQILGDSRGHVVHLGERECSIQRRHQKLIEEAPSPAITPDLRRQMGEVAVKAAKWVGYEGAGTVEFLFCEGKFYFLEVNARIQVEHPVTEMVTGIDMVKEQIRIASGMPLTFTQEDLNMKGSAIECRINAEDPMDDFAPTPGLIRVYHPPGGPGVRVDSGVHERYTIPPFYDPMISKLIAWGRDRHEAIMRMRRALREYVILGIKSNIAFHQAVLKNARFIKGQLGTNFIDNEPGIFEDLRKIIKEAGALEKKFSHCVLLDKKRIAAISAAAHVTQF